MGIMVGLPSPSGSEKDLQLNFGKNMTVQVEMRAPHLPAEWHTQSGIQLTWPHAGTDWAYMLTEVQECFINIAREIAERELLLIVTPEPEAVREQIASSVNIDNVRFLECETNDTWARDHGPDNGASCSASWDSSVRQTPFPPTATSSISATRKKGPASALRNSPCTKASNSRLRPARSPAKIRRSEKRLPRPTSEPMPKMRSN